MPSDVAVQYSGSCSSAENCKVVPEWHYRVRNTFIEFRPEKGPMRQSSCPSLLTFQCADDGTECEKRSKPVAIKLDDHIEKTSEAQPFSLFASVWPSSPASMQTSYGNLEVQAGSKGTDDPDNYCGCSAAGLTGVVDPAPEFDETESVETIVTPRISTLRCAQKDCDMTPPQPSKSDFVNIELGKNDSCTPNHVDSPYGGWSFSKQSDIRPEPSEQMTWCEQSAGAWSFSANAQSSEGWSHSSFYDEFHGVDLCGNTLPECSYRNCSGPSYQISLSETLIPTSAEQHSLDFYAPQMLASPKYGLCHRHAAYATKASQRQPTKPVSILLRGLPTRTTENDVGMLLDRASHLLGDSPCVRLLRDEHGECVGAAEVILPGNPDDVKIAKEVKKELHRTLHAGRPIDVVLPGVGHIAPLPK